MTPNICTLEYYNLVYVFGSFSHAAVHRGLRVQMAMVIFHTSFKTSNTLKDGAFKQPVEERGDFLPRHQYSVSILDSVSSMQSSPSLHSTDTPNASTTKFCTIFIPWTEVNRPWQSLILYVTHTLKFFCSVHTQHCKGCVVARFGKRRIWTLWGDRCQRESERLILTALIWTQWPGRLMFLSATAYIYTAISNCLKQIVAQPDKKSNI